MLEVTVLVVPDVSPSKLPVALLSIVVPGGVESAKTVFSKGKKLPQIMAVVKNKRVDARRKEVDIAII